MKGLTLVNSMDSASVVKGQNVEIMSTVEGNWVEMVTQAHESPPAASIIILVKLLPDYIFIFCSYVHFIFRKPPMLKTFSNL